MGEFTEFGSVRIWDSREERMYKGIKLRPAAGGDGYFVISTEDPQKSAFITEGTYQAILSDERNVTITI